jgi:hypothetical protein
VAGTCEYGNELPGSINTGNFLTSSSRRTLLHGVFVLDYNELFGFFKK